MNGTFPRSCAALAALALLTGCETSDKPVPSAQRERSQAVVVAAEPQAPEAPVVQASSDKRGAPGAEAQGNEPKSRKLCEPRTGKARQASVSATGLSRAVAPGEDSLPARLPVGGGQVTWVNFWAAWCVPCREEIPRLVAWEKQLRAENLPFQVVFVSLDDDERQLREFLAKQAPDGLRRTYWLREGSQREEWLAKADMDVDPRLPAHLLVTTEGESHCVVDGAVEDADFEEVRRLVKVAAGQ